MEALIAAIRLLLRRGSRAITGFIQRNRLNALPGVPTVLLVLIVGLAIPLGMRVDSRPTSISMELARLRLAEFLATSTHAAPDASPSGEIVSERPAFLWKAMPKAARYGFRLYEGNALWIGTDLVEAPWYLLPPPGRLEPGRTYRFTVEGLDGHGRVIGPQTGATFTLRAATEDLRALEHRVRAVLDSHESAFVLAGYYAERGWIHDLMAALKRSLAGGLEGEEAALARRVLARFGYH
jgi:hypothetical protein